MLNCCLNTQSNQNIKLNKSKSNNTINQDQSVKIFKNEIKNSQFYTQSFFESYNGSNFTNTQLTDFNLIQVIGIGRSGKVILVQSNKDNCFYAMKIVDKIYLKQKNLTINENQKMKLTDDNISKFLCQIYKIFQNKEKTYIIFEFVQGGKLFNHLKNINQFSEKWGMFYACQLIVALEDIHRSGYIYRSLNPQDILLDADGNIKLVDFGKKFIMVDERYYQENIIDQMYIAPEIIRKQKHDILVDFWSLGIIIYEILNGTLPFYNRDKQKMQEEIMNNQIKLNSQFSEEATDFVQNLLTINPLNRLGSKNGIQDLKNHPWFRNIDWQNIINQIYEPPIKPKVNSSFDSRYFDSRLQNQKAVDTPINTNFPKEFGSLVQSKMIYSQIENINQTTKNEQQSMNMQSLIQQQVQFNQFTDSTILY